ncbi:MAG: inorganic diphosphatase [Pyrinomonadaceae bacterium]
MSKETKRLFTNLETYDAESGDLNVIIDTPKGSRNKFKFNDKYAVFSLGGVLPAGAVFPFDFGYVPSTKGGDGDPLDVLVLMDEPAFVGCLVQSRLIGVIEAEQTEAGKTERNDRLIAVAAVSRVHREVRSLKDVSEQLIEEIEHFFVSYNAAKDKEFKPLGRFGTKRAGEIVKEGMKMFRRGRKSASKKRGAS